MHNKEANNFLKKMIYLILIMCIQHTRALVGFLLNSSGTESIQYTFLVECSASPIYKEFAAWSETILNPITAEAISKYIQSYPAGVSQNN